MICRDELAKIAREEALKNYHGFVMGTEPTIHAMVKPFSEWTIEEADSNWCAAFVYHCCILAGFDIPVRPKECVSCVLAGCIAWEEWAMPIIVQILHMNQSVETLFYLTMCFATANTTISA